MVEKGFTSWPNVGSLFYMGYFKFWPVERAVTSIQVLLSMIGNRIDFMNIVFEVEIAIIHSAI